MQSIYSDAAGNPYEKLKPLYNSLFGGLYLFADAIDENSVVVPSSCDVVGYARRDYADTTGYTVFGNFNVSESEVTDTYVKMVFDFATNKANGDIGSICLGTQLGCQMGIGGVPGIVDPPKSYEGYPYSYDTSISSVNIAYSEMSSAFMGAYYFCQLDEQNGIVRKAWCDTAGGHVYDIDIKTKKIGLLDTDYEVLKQIDIPIAANGEVVGYDSKSKKVYFISDSSWSNGETVTLIETDISNPDLDSATTVSRSMLNLTGNTLNIDTEKRYSCVYDGKMYFVGFTDRVVEMSCTDDSEYKIIANQDGHDFYNATGSGVLEVGGLIIVNNESGRVYNPVTEKLRPFLIEAVSEYATQYKSYKASNDGLFGITDYLSTTRLGLYAGALATINNLETPVNKTPDKTMKITYTLDLTN